MKKKIVSLALSCLAGSVFATVHTVSNVPNSIADFSGIQEAIDAATDGDTIYVGPSNVTYNSTYNINKQLTLIGSGTWPQGQNSNSSKVFRFNLANSSASGTTISGFVFTASTQEIYSFHSGTLQNITIENNKLRAVNFATPSMNNLTIRNNQFNQYFSTVCIQGSLSGTMTNCNIINNIFNINANAGSGVGSWNNSANNANLFANNVVFCA